MRTRTATAAAAVILLALTGCSTDSGPAEPAATTGAISEAKLTQQCIDAIADAISARPADFDPETDRDPQPTECNDLPEDTYLDAYMDGLEQANEAGRDALRDAIEDAANADE